MMVPMNDKLNKTMEETTPQEKIRLFYELAKYFLVNVGAYEELEDDDMITLFEDIANVVNDIENL